MHVRHTRSLERTLRHLERIARKTETQYASGTLARRDSEVLYEGLFIKSLVAFEKFLSDLFVAIMLGKTQHDRRYVLSKVSVRSTQAAESIILGGSRYVEWLPYDNTLNRARAMLRSGRPFDRLSSTDEASIRRWMAIRNTIVHSSAHSEALFQRRIIAGRHLSQAERTPGGFLQSQIRSGVSQFVHISQEMRAIAHLLLDSKRGP